MTPKVQRISSSKTKTLTGRSAQPTDGSAQPTGRDLICAVSTAQGRSAIAVVRGSGDGAFSALKDLFKTPTGTRAASAKARHAYYGNIWNGAEAVDDVIFFKFEGKFSFTGEDSFEIHCHGNPLIVGQILSLLYARGFRAAGPGEFTRRAYLNGKLDVDAAQAVAEIIEARNSESLKSARRLKSGSFRHEMLALRSALMNLLADLNAELDFIDEDISFATRETKLKILRDTKLAVEKLANDAERFDSFKDGVHIAILGKPNAGKSSLMNRLLGEERSIVSAIAGTTRDYIEGQLTIAGFNVRLFDTAGLNTDSIDPIEKLGIERTQELMGRAHICIHLLDGASPAGDANILSEQPLLRVVNKSDALHPARQATDDLMISAKTGAGIDLLLENLTQLIKERAPSNALPLNLWQRQLLGAIAENLQSAADAIEANEMPEVISHTVGLAVQKIAELTGEITSDDILGRIFSRFCIGK